MKLLAEVRRLRRQLDQSIHSNTSLADELRTRLSESTTHSHTRHSHSTRSAASQTRPQATSVHDCGASTSHDREHGVGETGARAGHDHSGSSTHNLSDSSSRSWTDGHVGRASISVTANLSPPQDASTPHPAEQAGTRPPPRGGSPAGTARLPPSPRAAPEWSVPSSSLGGLRPMASTPPPSTPTLPPHGRGAGRTTAHRLDGGMMLGLQAPPTS